MTSSPTHEDKLKYVSPLPNEFKWTKEDNLPEDQSLQDVEQEFGFRLIEVAGSFNYLAHTAVEEIFAVRKMCRFTRRPGRKHFKATLHLLHHLRCHPPKALVFPCPFGGLTADASMVSQDWP